MELKHIDIAKLSVSPVNMRGVKKAPDLTNILPSVRARGVLVPLIVRANGSPDTYEIVAGKRRYHAALAVAEEGGGVEELPCAIMEAGDDAAALEASLIENIARLDPDEVTRWETFTRLVREGRSPEAIAITFGLTSTQVKRTLALGNLLPRIRNLYRAEKIDAVTVRHLTLASKAQQLEWLALADDAQARAPVGQQLKAWLFGGASISTKVALFDLSDFGGDVVADLFGEDSYFASVEQFWTAQNAAVEERAEAYREAGWSEVVILEPGQPFQTWEHERRAKRKGGKVYIAIGHRGDVTFHEGYISLREARKLAKGQAVEKPIRPVLTRGLADEHNDRHYMIVAATDGRSHYVELGTRSLSEMLDSPEIVRVNPRVPSLREADRTIAEVAAANDGIYSVDRHLRHDASATERFAEAHVRRLEAMRRGRGEVERLADGSWKIAPDHLDRVLAFEHGVAAARPVEIETLSELRLDQMARHDGVTWLDEQNVAKEPEQLERGFGAQVRQALALRRQWLIEQGLAWRDGDTIHFRAGMMNELRQRELRQVAGQLSKEMGLGYAEHRGGAIEGTYRKTVQVGSVKYAVIEKSKEFTLVPWRPALEKQIGRHVSGIDRGNSIDWRFGRQRSGPEIGGF